MREIPGEDLYDAPTPTLRELVAILVRLQVECRSRVEDLLEVGLPDWRPQPLTDLAMAVVQRNASHVSQRDRKTLDALVDGLPRRFAALEECGIPDSLVHGDFAPGNARGDGTQTTLLDWGDCGIGHPLLDQAAFLDRIPFDLVPELWRHWETVWQHAIPGSDPHRAGGLLAPVAALRQAVIYQGFLDQIEPSEHPYHEGDPSFWLSRAASAAVARARGED